MSPKKARGLLLHGVLIAGTILALFPFYWMVVMATNSTADIYRFPPKLTFGSQLITNLRNVLDSIDFFGSMLNTLLVAGTTTLLVLFFDSLAAFAFAKYDFPGRRALFAVLIGTFFLPVGLAVIPQFVIMVELGWVGSLRALIIPAAANAFGIFFLRQYIQNAIPDSVLDAARLDGAGFFRQFVSVVLPIIRPGLAFLGIYTFIAAWNDFIWPLVVLVNPDQVTLQVALQQLNGVHGTDYSRIMAGALLSVLPLIVMFLIFARNFVSDLAKGAVRE
ncbi:carbohydrate ABC transporter permease [Phytohabitans rumicis]|uniref:Sugar ABC transporter permease n=1 Tax=Phytohabitans rumicis TaxID=1076125 RepID=A0A6V8KWY3_9ACTN|nr:carbohydrate ABC transporter permease [Phytohabitans rumicis]GFJ89592.1 sugar ABC transporter permease [Phytohabitans rumicis]